MNLGFGNARMTAVRIDRIPVHTDVVLHAGDGHPVTVDHVHWATHADAVIAPRHGAAKAADRLLRRCCERLAVDDHILADAEAMLDHLVAAAVRSTAHAVQIDLNVEQDLILVHVTLATMEHAMIRSLASALRGCSANPLSGSLSIGTSDIGTELVAEFRTRPPLAAA